MPIVELRDVVVLLGRFPALSGLNLLLNRAEVVLLQGPNGAGKSTFLRLCGGLLRPHSGSAVVLGHDLNTARAALRRRVGLLGHDSALYDDLSVVENLRFFAKATRLPPQTVVAALDRLELSRQLHSVPVRQLSAGQRRRVALATVVLRRPELWLLDEPHAGLDQEARNLLDELVAQAVSAGATVVMASHEHDRALNLATRTVTIVGGAVATQSQTAADTSSNRRL